MTTSPAIAAIAAVLCAALAATATRAAVYRCDDPGGTPRFSQFPCGNGSRVVVDRLDTVHMPALSDAERELLDELQRQQDAERKARARAQAQMARSAQAERKQRRRRCDAARKQRAALAQKRRKGYGIEEARELDRRSQELAAELKQNC